MPSSFGFALISVALCTHNGARFIGEQVRSICLQTLPPQEIVISDDASSDECIAVALATFDECKRAEPERSIDLRVIENSPPLRVTKNFEQAVLACRGDLIALSDQDDVWHPERLARMAAEFERRADLLLLHTDARLVGADRRDLGETLFHALEVLPFELDWIHGDRAFDVFLRRNLVTGATTVFRRSLLVHAAPFPVEWLHDEWLAIIAAAVGRVDVLEEQLVDYRQHESNQIGAQRDTYLRKVQKALASRGDRNERHAIKAELLLARLLALDTLVAPETITKVREKLAHQRFRAALPPGRLARILPVAREALKGRYDRFGRGARGVVRDLFESV